MLDVREYIAAAGRSPFTQMAANAERSSRRLQRIANGNLSNVKTVGSGILEYKVDFGPGYRIYFGRDGERLVILLAGGTNRAKENWKDYRNRKTPE